MTHSFIDFGFKIKCSLRKSIYLTYVQHFSFGLRLSFYFSKRISLCSTYTLDLFCSNWSYQGECYQNKLSTFLMEK